MWKHANKNRYKNNTQFSEHFRKKSPPLNTRITFQSIKISEFSRIACFQTPLAARTLGAHVIHRLFKKYIPIVRTHRLDSLTIKNWKRKIYMVIFNFWFIWSFAASACGRHRKIRTQKKNFWHSGYSGRQKKYCTNVIKTTPNMDRVMGTWFELLNNCHMIKNTELEFKQRTDIYCDKLERILLPPGISLSNVEEGSGQFAILGRDFDLILGQIVSVREKTLGNTHLVASCHIQRNTTLFRLTCGAQKRLCLSLVDTFVLQESNK